MAFMGLGERIQEAIDGSKDPDGNPKTKAQIARECEVTGGAVTQWLSGDIKSLKADTALALEQATGFRAYWILHGKGPKRTTDPVSIWPFPKVPLERFTALDPEDKGYVQRRLLQAIEECEVHNTAPAPLSVIQHRDEIEHPPEVPFSRTKRPPGKRHA